MVTYIVVKLKLSEKRFVVRVSNWCLTGKSSVCKNSSFRHSTASPRSKENKKLFQRVSFIIFTDLLCWTRLCIAAFVVASHPIRITSGTDNRYYLHRFFTPVGDAISCCIQQYFESVHIHSYHLWKKLLAKMKNKVANYSSKSHQDFGLFKSSRVCYDISVDFIVILKVLWCY